MQSRFYVRPALARRAWGAAAVALSLLGAAGCQEGPSGSDDREVAIGGIFSLTGNWMSLGVTSKAAMEVAVEDANRYAPC